MFRVGDPVRMTLGALAARRLSPNPINRARGRVVAVGAGVTVQWGEDIEGTFAPDELELALRNHFASRPPACTEAP